MFFNSFIVNGNIGIGIIEPASKLNTYKNGTMSNSVNLQIDDIGDGTEESGTYTRKVLYINSKFFNNK